MKRKIIGAIGIVVILGVVYAVFAFFHQSGGLNTFKMPRAKVKVVHAVVKNIPLRAVALGQIQSLQNIAVDAQQSGDITDVLVKNGQVVRKGQLLFTIDHKTQKAKVSSADALYQEALMHFDRMTHLLKVGAVSQDTFDTAKAQKNTAKASLHAAQKAYAQTFIRASFNGRATYTDLAKGSFVEAGTRLINIVSNDALELQYELPAGLLPLARIGQEVTFKTSLYPNQVMHASVNYVSPDINETDHAFTVRATILTHQSLLEPGLSVMVSQILKPQRKVLAIPGISLKGDPNGLYVFILNDKNKILEKRIVIGERLDSWVEVKSGLTSQDKIVVEGQASVHEGQTVKVAS